MFGAQLDEISLYVHFSCKHIFRCSLFSRDSMCAIFRRDAPGRKSQQLSMRSSSRVCSCLRRRLIAKIYPSPNSESSTGFRNSVFYSWSFEVHWISFHGSYDFGYFLKILTCQPLPDEEDGFFDLLRAYFPSLYDIKSAFRSVSDSVFGASAV